MRPLVVVCLLVVAPLPAADPPARRASPVATAELVPVPPVPIVKVFRLERVGTEEAYRAVWDALGRLDALPGERKPWKAAFDPRTRVILVRGSDRHRALAADVIAVLDRPVAAKLPPLTVTRGYRLAHAEADPVATILGELELDGVVVLPIDNQVLLVVAPEPTRGLLDQLVRELDAAEKLPPPRP